MRGRRIRALILCLVAFAANTAIAAPPSRVASLGLCTDELLVALADRSDVASLSPMARDPAISTVADVARQLPDNFGSAEIIVHERADLVLGLPGAAAAVVDLLRRLGITVVIIDEPISIAAIAPTIRKVAALLGQAQRGEAAIARMNAKLAALQRPAAGNRPAALFYDSNGLTVGANTLEDDVLAAAGLENYARRQDLDTGKPVSLETIVTRPPDLLVTRSYRADEASLAESWPENPVLRAVRHRVTIPDRLLICGTPAVADAASMLAVASGER